MKIWLINHYGGTMFLDKGGRHYCFAKYLKRLGHEPIIICSNALHEEPKLVKDTNDIFFKSTVDGIEIPFVFIKGRTYIGNGKHRALNILDFYRYLMKSVDNIVTLFGKPDVVLGSSIHPLAPVAAIKISKKLGCKSICEYRDLWPDELISMGAMGEHSIPAVLLRKIEHWTYKNADALVFTMEGATEYIKKRKWDLNSGGDVDLLKATYINNGVDLEEYRENAEAYKVDDADLNDTKSFKVVYTGTIRRANGIDKILEIAKKTKDYPQIKYLLYGAGSEVDDVIRQIREEHLTNVIYKGVINKRFIPYVLSKSDLNLLNYLNGNLFRYGCSNNKLFEYMASGKPILCTIKMNYSILRKYECGIEVDEKTTIDEIADIIKTLYMKPQIATRYKDNTVRAIKEFDFLNLAKKMEEVMLSIM